MGIKIELPEKMKCCNCKKEIDTENDIYSMEIQIIEGNICVAHIHCQDCWGRYSTCDGIYVGVRSDGHIEDHVSKYGGNV